MITWLIGHSQNAPVLPFLKFFRTSLIRDSVFLLCYCFVFYYEKFTLFYAYMYVQTVYQVCDYSALGMIIPETTCCSLSTALTLTNEIVQGQVSYSPISTVWIQILADFITKQNQVMCSLILKLAVIIYFNFFFLWEKCDSKGFSSMFEWHYWYII